MGQDASESATRFRLGNARRPWSGENGSPGDSGLPLQPLKTGFP